MTARKRIIHVSPLSIAKVMALTYGVLGILAAMVLAVARIAGAGGPRNDFDPVFLAIFPFLYAAGGFLGGLIMAAIYNMVASAVGGVVIDLADEQPWE
jgi:hypothetical protein